jgi:hypothetical protein
VSSPIDQEAIAILGEVTLETFTTTPSVVKTTQLARLDWKVSLPPNTTGIRVLLNNFPVQSEATLKVQLLDPRIFLLESVLRGVRTTLGSVRVDVDYSGCIEVVIDEQLVQPELNDAITAFTKSKGFELLEPVRLKIDTSGFSVAARLGFVGFETDVAFRLYLFADRGEPKGVFLGFNLDIDAPWYVDFATLGLVEIFTNASEGPLEDAVKPVILETILGKIRERVDGLPNLKLGRIRMMTNAITITMCPLIETGIGQIDVVQAVLTLG